MKKITVIITHFQKPEMLRVCIRSVQKALSSIDSEIIVTDSMTTDKTRGMMSREFNEILFLSNKDNIGYARLVNQGIAHASGEYILVLNSDLLVDENAIGTMLAYMQKHSDVGMLGPQLRYFNDDFQQSYFRFYTPLTIISRRTFLSRLPHFKHIEDTFLMKEVDREAIQTPDWIMGSAMMIRSNLVEKIGGMDERFFMYFEDVDWCRRVWHNGYKVVYLPSAIMHHYLGRASKSKLGIFDALFNKHTRWHIRSAISFFLKYRKLEHIQAQRKLQIQSQ